MTMYTPLYVKTALSAEFDKCVTINQEWWIHLKLFVEGEIDFAFPEPDDVTDKAVLCEQLMQEAVCIIETGVLKNADPAALANIMKLLSTTDVAQFNSFSSRDRNNKPTMEIMKEGLRYAVAANIQIAFLHAIANSGLEELRTLAEEHTDTFEKHHEALCAFAQKKGNAEIVNFLQQKRSAVKFPLILAQNKPNKKVDAILVDHEVLNALLFNEEGFIRKVKADEIAVLSEDQNDEPVSYISTKVVEHLINLQISGVKIYYMSNNSIENQISLIKIIQSYQNHQYKCFKFDTLLVFPGDVVPQDWNNYCERLLHVKDIGDKKAGIRQAYTKAGIIKYPEKVMVFDRIDSIITQAATEGYQAKYIEKHDDLKEDLSALLKQQNSTPFLPAQASNTSPIFTTYNAFENRNNPFQTQNTTTTTPTFSRKEKPEQEVSQEVLYEKKEELNEKRDNLIQEETNLSNKKSRRGSLESNIEVTVGNKGVKRAGPLQFNKEVEALERKYHIEKQSVQPPHKIDTIAVEKIPEIQATNNHRAAHKTTNISPVHQTPSKHTNIKYVDEIIAGKEENVFGSTTVRNSRGGQQKNDKTLVGSVLFGVGVAVAPVAAWIIAAGVMGGAIGGVVAGGFSVGAGALASGIAAGFSGVSAPLILGALIFLGTHPVGWAILGGLALTGIIAGTICYHKSKPSENKASQKPTAQAATPVRGVLNSPSKAPEPVIRSC